MTGAAFVPVGVAVAWAALAFALGALGVCMLWVLWPGKRKKVAERRSGCTRRQARPNWATGEGDFQRFATLSASEEFRRFHGRVGNGRRSADGADE